MKSLMKNVIHNHVKYQVRLHTMETLAIVLLPNYAEGLITKSLMKNVIHNHVEYQVHHVEV